MRDRRRILRTLSLLLPILAVLVLSRSVRGDGLPPEEGWEKVTGPMVQPGESLPASRLVAAAYGFIWLMVAGYVLSVWHRTRAVEREVEALRRRVERAEAEPKR